MDADMLFGLTAGAAWAVLDALLLRYLTRRAARDREHAQGIVAAGFAARYLLTFAVLAFALLLPGLNPVGVIAPLIAQKAVLVMLALFGK